MFREETTSALIGFHADPLSWSNLNLEMLVFVEGGKPEKNPRSIRQEPTTQICLWAGIELGPHWWEASVLTSASSLLPTTGVFPWFTDLMTVFQDKPCST